MNDLFRAYGRFDAAVGALLLSIPSSTRGTVPITGYVKPLFKDLKVYDKRQDKSKTIARKLYEGVVGGVAKILKNRPRDEVATKAEVLGRIDNPQGRHRGRRSSDWSRTPSSRRSCPGSTSKWRAPPAGTARGEMTGTVRVTE